MTWRIIVADNSPTVQKILEIVFPGPDYELRRCVNGEELFMELDGQKPDALILSLSLPGGDVYEMVAKINSQPEFRDLPIILLQNIFEPIDEIRLASLVYTGLVTKPFDSEKVASLIKQTLGGSEEPAGLPEEIEDKLPALLTSGKAISLQYQEILPSIRSIIMEEMISLERELEKRITASLRNELKDWLEAKLSRLKGKEKNE